MTIRHMRGDLLRSQAQCIVHQVNNRGMMRSGVAEQIRYRWPEVYASYIERCRPYLGPEHSGALMGCIDCVEIPSGQVVISLFGQRQYEGVGEGRRTRYDAVYQGLERVRDYMLARGLRAVAFPEQMSCGKAGGAWGVIFEIIKAVFKDTDIDIEIISWDSELKENELSEVEGHS